MTSLKRVTVLELLTLLRDVRRRRTVSYRDRKLTLERGDIWSGVTVTLDGFPEGIYFSVQKGRIQQLRDIDYAIDILNGEDRWDRGFVAGWDAHREAAKEDEEA